MTTTHTITITSLEEAVTRALSFLLRVEEGQRQASGATIVFSGEGATPADATRDALADLVAQCDAHGCAPVSLATDGVMRTDDGYRVWGTVTCSDGPSQAPVAPDGITVNITGEEGRGWTLTISEA